MSYYNTNSETGEQFKNAVRKAQSQDEKLYKALKERGQSTAWEIRNYLRIEVFGAVIEQPLITSVRRSLNTLLKQGKVKEVEKVKNHFGRLEIVWQAI